ncbi:MAG: glycoside hydrolase family 127 protein, partial [Planctomycetota bacterium]
MTVWLPRNRSAARPLPAPTIASKSKVTVSYGSEPSAVNDQMEPKNSNDHSFSYYHYWPHKGTAEWLQMDFDKQYEISSVEVYFFDDTGQGECRIPESWKILYKQ